MMNPEIIDVHEGSTSESWLCVYPDGRIELHTENNGHYILRYGPGATGTGKLITMADIEQLGQRHGKRLIERVRASLVKFGYWLPMTTRRPIAEYDSDGDYVDFRCFDCGYNTVQKGRPQEFYMVHDEVWLAAGMTKQRQRQSGDFLCIGCLEARLGRTLTRRDFTNPTAYQPEDPHDSLRLKARLLAM